jgi:hypothetical protein
MTTKRGTKKKETRNDLSENIFMIDKGDKPCFAKMVVALDPRDPDSGTFAMVIPRTPSYDKTGEESAAAIEELLAKDFLMSLEADGGKRWSRMKKWLTSLDGIGRPAKKNHRK